MKPNGSQVVFSGPFSASLTDFVKYKRTLGRNYYGMARILLRFDVNVNSRPISFFFPNYYSIGA